MKLILTFVFLLIAAPSLAQSVVVKSGEHGAFTRLVVDLGRPVAWQLGRTEDGYELRLGREISFDLSAVYRLIDKRRLAAIEADPRGGILRLGLGCQCHAIPFEFRPGIIVVDLRDGPAPEGSSFELGLDAAASFAAELFAYDWRDIASHDRSAAADELRAAQVGPRALPLPDPTLQPLRDALLTQLSRGAVQGLVDMTLPLPRDREEGLGEGVGVYLGEVPGMQADTAPRGAGSLTGAGDPCLAEVRLDIAGWGDARPVIEQMAEAMQDIIGEFDQPQPDGVARAVRFLLHIGFGAEARALLAALPADGPNDLPDAAIWMALSHIVDGESPPLPLFGGMQVCAGAAALWAVLEAPALRPGEPVETAAVIRSFSALPGHLRRLIGPTLADRFLATGDVETARTIRDAVARLPDVTGGTVTLMEARHDIQTGAPEKAEERLAEIVEDPGPLSAEALLARVQAQLARQAVISETDIVGLEAFSLEYAGGEDEERFRSALALAEATTGDFNAAFGAAEGLEDVGRQIWDILGRTGPDDALLAYAIRPAAELMPDLPSAHRQKLAERLLTLGFADQALGWLSGMEKSAPLLLARVEMARRDARATLRHLAGLEGSEAAELRAQALRQLGDYPASASVYAALGDTENLRLVRSIARDWEGVTATAEEPWLSAVQLLGVAGPPLLLGVPAEPLGPLAAGQALVEESAVARSALEAFLIAVPGPALP